MKKLGVPYVFVPSDNFVNRNNKNTSLKVNYVSKELCGLDRPGHFNGVATIIVKLINIVRPNFIILGEKDFQQILVIKQLIKDLCFDVKILTVKTVREKNGLAFSSRNIFLNEQKKNKAKEIFSCLKHIKKEIKNGQFNIDRLDFFRKHLLNNEFEKVNYLKILNEQNLGELSKTPQVSRLFISADINGVRLIDNIFLGKLKKIKQFIFQVD